MKSKQLPTGKVALAALVVQHIATGPGEAKELEDAYADYVLYNR